MLRLAQIVIGSIALLFNVVAIIFFCDWLGETDLLMGHTYGPASSVLTATWSAGAGVLFFIIWMVIWVFKKTRSLEARQQKRSGWRLLQGAT